MRWRRLLLVLLVTVPLLAYLGLRLYLASSWGRQQVEEELALAIGARVELGQVDAGLFATTLHDLRIFLPGDTDTPTVAVDELRLPLPLWRLLDEGDVLQNLHLQGPAITLRFDRAGRFLSEPPQGESRGTPS